MIRADGRGDNRRDGCSDVNFDARAGRVRQRSARTGATGSVVRNPPTFAGRVGGE